MSFGKGSTSTTTQTAPNPVAAQNYYNLMNQAATVAATPYQAYTGEQTAPVNAEQQTGIAGINANANSAQPSVNAGEASIAAGSSPLTAAQIQQYQSPYTQDVVNATEAQFNNQNQQQQSQVVGNAAAQGALGGDRVGVAQANTAQAQNLAQAPVIAGLYNTGYNNAVQTAEQQQQTQIAGGQAQANTGIAGQSAALSGAGAEVSGGTLEQQTQQAQDTAAYQAFLQQQAYPFQTTQWEAGIDTGVGSQLGGTSSTTPPQPNPYSTVAGLGLAALSFAKDGGRIKGFASGGTPNNISGTPYAGVNFSSWVPSMDLKSGSGAPPPPSVNQAQKSPFSDASAKGIANLTKKAKDWLGSDSSSAGQPVDLAPTNNGVDLSNANTFVGPTQDAVGLGPLYADGGEVKRYRPNIYSNTESGRDEDNMHRSADVLSAADTQRKASAYPMLMDRQMVPRRGFADAGYVPVQAGFGTGSMVPDDTFDDRFGVAPNNIPDPATYNNIQTIASTYPEAQNGIWAGPMQDTPMPRSRPDEAQTGVGELPPEITSGESRPKKIEVPDDESEPLAFDTPTRGVGAAPPAAAIKGAEESSGLGLLDKLGIHVSSEARQGMLAAGLGMLASRSPNLWNAVGEGGLQGVNAYAGAKAATQSAKKEQADEDYKKNSLAQQADLARERIKQETAKMAQEKELHFAMTPYQQSQVDRQKLEDAIKLRTPVKAYETRSGMTVNALPKVNKDTGEVDLHLIHQDGSIDPNPWKPGAPVQILGPAATPASSPSQQPEPATGTQSTPSAATPAAPAAAPAAEAPAPEETLPQRSSAPAASPQSRDNNFLAKIAQDDPGYARMIQGVADYTQNPNALFSLRGNRRENAMRDVMLYDPTYDVRQFNARNKAIGAFASGPMANTVRSFNVAISHINTLEGLTGALQNHDTQLINRFVNMYKEQTGQPAPTEFNAVKAIVADEIVKAVVGSGSGALGDREEIANQIKLANSPAQLAGVMGRFKDLMAGQVAGVKQQYEDTTGLHNFDSRLSPETRAALNGHGENKSVGTDKNKAALDWANANPTDPRAVEIKKRLKVQ